MHTYTHKHTHSLTRSCSLFPLPVFSSEGAADPREAATRWSTELKAQGFAIVKGFRILPGSTSRLTVFFKPASLGARELSLRIFTSGSFVSLTLRGVGAEAKLQFALTPAVQDTASKPTQSGEQASLDLTLGCGEGGTSGGPELELDFGSKSVGHSFAQTVYICNSGLVAAEFSLSRDLPAEFQVGPLLFRTGLYARSPLQVRPMAGVVPARGHVPVHVRFSPEAVVKSTAVLRLLVGGRDGERARENVLRPNAHPRQP
jgi:hypothetical protein